jgi:hypothetical protein
LANDAGGTENGLSVAAPESAKAVFDSERMTEPRITPRVEGTVPRDERSPLGAGTIVEIEENDMHALLGRGRLLSIAAVAVLASACASTDDVKHAQATADQALSAAQAAQREADQNRADINTLNQKVDDLQRAPHRPGGQRG